MSDTPASDQAATQAEAPIMPLRFLGQYIRDLSFEVPNAPSVFNEVRKYSPEIPVSIDCAVRHLGGSGFEVSLNVNVAATVNSRPAFIAEIVYAAVIEVDERAIPPEQLHAVLLIEVPRLLFPFVRQIVGDVTVGGGFPPLMLQMIDFVEMYRRKYGDQPQTIERKPAPQAVAS
jgi:preprotein translocase subunit SecB